MILTLINGQRLLQWLKGEQVLDWLPLMVISMLLEDLMMLLLWTQLRGGRGLCWGVACGNYFLIN